MGISSTAVKAEGTRPGPGFRTALLVAAALAVTVAFGSGCAGIKSAGGSDPGLESRVRALEDRAAILDLLSRYSLNVDMGRADAFLALFTEECLFVTDVAGELVYRRGKAELGQMVATRPPRGQHLQLDYTIRLSGETAIAVGYQDLTSLREGSLSLSRGAYRFVRFRRVSGAWLIHEVYTIGIENEEIFLKILPEGAL